MERKLWAHLHSSSLTGVDERPAGSLSQIINWIYAHSSCISHVITCLKSGMKQSHFQGLYGSLKHTHNFTFWLNFRVNKALGGRGGWVKSSKHHQLGVTRHHPDRCCSLEVSEKLSSVLITSHPVQIPSAVDKFHITWQYLVFTKRHHKHSHTDQSEFAYQQPRSGLSSHQHHVLTLMVFHHEQNYHKSLSNQHNDPGVKVKI